MEVLVRGWDLQGDDTLVTNSGPQLLVFLVNV